MTETGLGFVPPPINQAREENLCKSMFVPYAATCTIPLLAIPTVESLQVRLSTRYLMTGYVLCVERERTASRPSKTRSVNDAGLRLMED